MAVSPDLMPICSTCVGIIGRRLNRPEFLPHLILGMGCVMLVSFIVALLSSLSASWPAISTCARSSWKGWLPPTTNRADRPGAGVAAMPPSKPAAPARSESPFR